MGPSAAQELLRRVEALDAQSAQMDRVSVAQEIDVDVGLERAAYVVRALVALPRSDQAQTYALVALGSTDLVRFEIQDEEAHDTDVHPPAHAPWSLPSALLTVGARVLSGGRPEPTPGVVAVGGYAFLYVPPTRMSTKEGNRKICVTLHLTTALCARRADAPFAVQLPVVWCPRNRISCRLYGFEGDLDLASDPPLEREEGSDAGTAQVAGTFVATTLFAMEWSRALAGHAHELPQLVADSAETHCAVHASPTTIWDGVPAPAAALSFTFDVFVTGPALSTLAQEASLPIALDACGQRVVWHAVEVQGDPSVVRLVPDGEPEDADEEAEHPTYIDCSYADPGDTSAGEGALNLLQTQPAVVHPAHMGPLRAAASLRRLKLRVNAAAVCGSFGNAPCSPLVFQVRGEALLPYARQRIVSGVDELALPLLRLPTVDRHDIAYRIRSSPDSAPLELLRPAPAARAAPVHLSVAPERFGAASPDELCIVAFAPRPNAAPAAPSTLPALSAHHEVWPCAEGAKGVLQHRTVLLLHGGSTHPAVLDVFSLPAQSVAPTSLTARVDGEPAVAHLQLQVSDSTSAERSAAAEAPVRLALHLEVPSNAGRGPSVHVDVSYTTPWDASGDAAFTAVRPAFAMHVPAAFTRINGTGALVPRLVRAREERVAHIAYAQDLRVATFELSAHEPAAYEVQLVPVGAAALASAAAPRSVVPYVVVALLALAVWHLHAQVAQLRAHADIMAMALDIDFADGQWSAALPGAVLRASRRALAQAGSRVLQTAQRLPWASRT